MAKKLSFFWLFKNFISILFFFCLSVLAYGANYYVSSLGSNTAPYDTWAKAAKQIKTVIDYIRTNGSGAGDYVYIGEGTFNSANDYFYIDNANLSNLTIIGAGRNATIVSPGSANRAVYGTIATGVTFKNLCLTSTYSDPTKANIYTAGNNWRFEDVDVVSLSNHTTRLFTFEVGKIDCIRCRFKFRYASGGSTIFGQIQTTANGTFDYCIFEALGSSSFNGGLLFYEGSGNYNFNNCVYLNSGVYGISTSNGYTGTININNCIISTNNTLTSYYPINKNGGTINVRNTLVMCNFVTPFSPWNSVDLDQNNIKDNSDPKFRTYKRMGFIIPRVDDNGGYPYVQSLEPVFSSYGIKGTYYIYTYTFPTNLSYYRAILSNGIFEIGCHSYSHSALNSTQAYSITKAGATINIDRTNNQIIINPGGTVTSFKSKTLDQIKTELQRLGCTIGSYPTGLTGNTLGESLADSSGAQPSPYTPSLLIDTTAQTGFFKVEIADPMTHLNNNLGDLIDPQTNQYYSCKTFVFPHSVYTNDAITAVMNAGYKMCGIIAINKSMTADLDLFRIYICSASSYLKDTTEALVRQRARAIGFAVKQGLIVQVIAHNASELTAEQWGWAIDEWLKMGIPADHITSAQLVAKYIEESGLWTSQGSGVWTREYEDDDYHLTANSPCINTGLDLGLMKDFEERSIPCEEKPEIGVYEYCKQSFPFVDDFNTDKGWIGFEYKGWERGPAIRGGGQFGNPDPEADHSATDDNYILGFAIGDDYPNSLTEKSIISPPIDCSGQSKVYLKFWRYLNVESNIYDHAKILVSNDGVNWIQLWENPIFNVTDNQWKQVVFDISSITANQPNVFIKFTMGPTNSYSRFSGWNIDDLEVTSEFNGPIALYVSQVNLINPNISEILIENGFGIIYVDDIPVDLSNYSLLILNKENPYKIQEVESIKNFIQKGGGAVIIGKDPKFLAGDNEDLSSIKEWFGAGWYDSDCGYATTAFNHPFGGDLVLNDIVDYSMIENCNSNSIFDLKPEATLISKWEIHNRIHSFIHSFGQGRIFYYAGEPGHCDDPGYPNSEILENGLYLFEEGLIWAGNKNYLKGDFDFDGDVDGNDLAIFASEFGRTNCYELKCLGDFDNDGDVDGLDLAIFSINFGSNINYRK